MSVEIDIDEHGLAALAFATEELSERSKNLTPVAWRIRTRWIESERRLFAVRPWKPRAATTLRRYRYPVRHSTDEQMHRVEGDVMHFTGFTERSLTTAQSIGTRDAVSAVSSTFTRKKKDGTVETGRRPGGLDLTVGIKSNGPLFYAAINEAGAGSRPVRTVVVFDDRAHADATGDVVDYLIEHFEKNA